MLNLRNRSRNQVGTLILFFEGLVVVMFLGSQFLGCQSQVHERGLQIQSPPRDFKAEIKTAALANSRIEDAERFLLRILEIIDEMKGSAPVAFSTGDFDDMHAAIKHASQSLYQIEEGQIVYSGEIGQAVKKAEQGSSEECSQRHYSIKYDSGQDKLEIVIFDCDSVIRKTVLSSNASENKIRISNQVEAAKGIISRYVFGCESTLSRQISCENIALSSDSSSGAGSGNGNGSGNGTGVGSDSRWFLDFSHEKAETKVTLKEIDNAGDVVRTQLEFEIDSEGNVKKVSPP